MDRVLVTGTSGAGKTTLAQALSAKYGLPHYELDALHHGPGWTSRPEFEADVQRFSAQPYWVTEDQYHRFLGDLLWQRADTVIWLDLPRHIVMTRLLRRSIFRTVTRKQLWNGNREHWGGWLQPDHPVHWTWKHFHRKRTRTQHRADQHPDITVIRLTTTREIQRLIEK